MVYRLFYIPFAVILYCPFSYTGKLFISPIVAGLLFFTGSLLYYYGAAIQVKK
jgi:hypothetical protein